MPKQITELDIAARIAPAAIRWPSTAIHWEKLKKAVDAIRMLVAAVDANCKVVEQDPDLSLEGIARKRVDIARRALGELVDFAPQRSAESAVASALSLFEAGMIDLPKPPAGLAEVALAQELRAHVRAQQNPAGFVLNHLDDARLVGAVLHAPGFLSGLADEGLNVIRDRSRSALHPEQVQLRKDAEDALEELHRAAAAARRMIVARTDTRLDGDGQVRDNREPGADEIA
ncbi:hypothetical protein EJ074_28015 [Mesorhizobium sp. M3A.F.Ca.ET.080.04.2.1]|uniref:hypothetical protein n=1 Tax=Mesorhizobium sp. M3A.F.Ca.ET.080.04.2.1 TaxID=2493676 RepID=UPI000F75428D|nr:hypothetical protein [Mesorhizobium sp. M3A.F.Ca.ET.080.04.2.1]AZO12541.1 hypothetical protein EJ074_28015 [Mesorhizobium sp. M3A.F.Ca.ET.080.04.2.1]RWF26450.1 MAG: hypothetical protein EOS64_01445 [Mesorhizobium sp.]